MLLFICSFVSNSFATPWTVAFQAPLSMGFPRQEYWRGLPFLSPRDLSNPVFEPVSPALQADSLPLGSPRTRSRRTLLQFLKYSVSSPKAKNFTTFLEMKLQKP